VSTAGYDLIAQRSSVNAVRQDIYWGDLSQERASRRDGIAYGSVWADRRTELGERVTIDGGVRLDVGGGRTLDAVRPAGSAQARVALSPGTWISVGASRSHQYVQGLDLPIVARGQTAPTLWLTAGNDVPMMSIDNAMVGFERWMNAGLLVAANAYARHTSGEITDDPTPGPLTHRPLFVDATESARGVELSARKLAGRVTGLLAYSYGNAAMNARGLSFAAPANRRHAFDAATSVRLGRFSLGGAYTLTSGAPYTRTVFESASSGAEASPQIPVREAPYAERLPSYSSLDVSLDYAHSVRGAWLMGFLGVQNVLGRTNATWYQSSGYCVAGQPQSSADPECRARDLLAAPVKFAPTAGLRLVF
jgi:hypothetical protein